MNKLKDKKYLFISFAIVIGLSLIITAIARNTFAVTYVCPDGFSPIAGTSGAMCEKAADVTEETEYYCTKGELQVNKCYITVPAETKTVEQSYSGTFDHYYCSSGSLDGSGCYDFTSKEKYCSSGTLSGSKCKHSQRMNVNSCTGTCSDTISSGGTVTCMCTWETSAGTRCPTGYSEYANGSTCRKFLLTASRMYRCDDGTVSISSTCTRTVSSKQCPSGTTEVPGTGGNVCSQTVSAEQRTKYKYSCTSGTLNGSTNKCEIAANPIGDDNNCPIGSTPSGNTCVCNTEGMIYNSATNKCEPDPTASFAFDVERPSSSAFTAWCQSNGGSIQTVDTVNNIVKCVKTVDWTTNTEYPDSTEFRRWCSSIGGTVQSVSGTNLVRCYYNKTCGTNASWSDLTNKCVCNPGWSGNPVTGCSTIASENKVDYSGNGEKRCPDGYHDDENDSKKCVQDSDYTPSGVYYMVGGTCKPYPAFNGYCIEKGVPHSSSAEYETVVGSNSSVSLTCEQLAAAYITKDSSTKDYAAQSILNGRTYYTDSSCKNAVSTSSLRSQASQMCSSPNFGSPSASTSNNILFGHSYLSLLNRISDNYKVVKTSLDGKTYAMKPNQTICIPDTSGTLSKYTIKTSGDGNATAEIRGNQLCITSGDREGSTVFNLSRIITSTSTTSTTSYQPVYEINEHFQKKLKDYQEVTTEEEVVDYSVVRMSLSVVVSEEPVDLKGGFKLIKKNSEGSPLEGVEFLIGTSVKDGKIENPTTKTTDENGEILLENLEAGQTYYYQEKKTLDNYILDEEIRSLVIEHDKIIEVELINYQKDKGGFRILKIDNFGNPLKNVKFKVGTDLNGTEGTDWNYMTTGEKGIIIVGDLDVDSKYYYQEVEAPDGYYLEGSIREIKIDSTEIVDIKVVNEKYTRDVKITKTSEDDKPLEGAVISIYNADDDSLIETGITNKDGIIEFHNLSYGNYYALEKEAPKGYELNNNKHEFTITDLTESINIPMKNYKINNPITADLPIIIVIMIGIVGIGYGIYKYRTMKLNKEK